jgi:hypothetical protein
MPSPLPGGPGYPFFVSVITLDLSGMGGPTSSISYRQHSSQDHVTIQFPPLCQSSDTFEGGGVWSSNLKNEEAMTRVVSQHHRKKVDNSEPDIFVKQCQHTTLAFSAVWSAGPRMTLPLLCFLHFPTKATAMASFLSLLFFWLSRLQSPKFSLTRGAGRCKSFTSTHYFHPPHKDQSVRLYRGRKINSTLTAFIPPHAHIYTSSSSSCLGRIRFDSCSLYPQNEIGPSISLSVFLCVFVLLVHIVVLV